MSEVSTYSECPNCSAKIKSSVFSNNEILDAQKIKLVNEYFKPEKEAYCGKCGNDLLFQATASLQNEVTDSY